MSGDLRRVEARDEKQGQELPVVRLQVRKRALEVDQLDRICRVATRGTIRRVRDVEDGPASLPTEGLTRFIGGDRDQPRPDLTSVGRRLQAIDRADCTASHVASVFPQTTNATANATWADPISAPFNYSLSGR